MPEAGVEFANVSYALASDASGGGRVLIRDVTLALAAGKTTALLGRSGSGKTTLLRMVNGLVVPTSGKVLVGGREAWRSVEEQVALRRGIGYVIQETGLFPHMTVERNAGMALELAGQSRGQREGRVREVLGMAGLDFGEYGGR
jgi:osmoprotectant transport system ATP-binding protein